MKVLLVVDDFLPHSTKVAARMMHELALEFILQNHEVTVLTPSSDINQKMEERDILGVNTVFFKTGRLKNISRIKRAINESLLSKKAWDNCKDYFKNSTFDAIVYYSPSIFWGNLVKRLKKEWNVPAYLILRDIFPQWTVDNGMMKENGSLHRFFKWFEEFSYNQANRIGVMSNANLNYFKNRFGDKYDLEILMNWTSSSKINPCISKDLRKELNLRNKVVFFYGGNIGTAQHMISLVDLCEALKSESEAHFLFVGNGDEVELILEEKKKRGLTNLSYLPSVDQETYKEYLKQVDIGLFSLHPDHKTHNFPGKLLGYMDNELPILGYVNRGNDLMDLVNEARAGFICNSGERDVLVSSALILLKDTSKRRTFGVNGKILLESKFSTEAVVESISGLFAK